MHDVARSFKMKGYNLKDNPSEIEKYKKFFLKNQCF